MTNTGTSLTPVATTSGFKLASVEPGDYEFTIPALPFISTTEKKVVVSSATNDTSSLSTLLDVGSRTARYIDLRDLRSQSIRKGMTAAVAPNGNAAWFDAQGDWRSFSNIQVSMNSAGTSITITAKNASNQNVTATLPVTDSRVSLRARDGNSSLLRIETSPDKVGFVTTTTTSSIAEGEGSSIAPPSHRPVAMVCKQRAKV